ncbi:MerR family transcriptional regulator [Pseudovibrio sp. SCP19]|uniref:MerR family transcriptional regulator n=1 Tax=Pseudovibrio sp. SCP19 TaxID=3141374 RepID=UPI00333BC487
MENELREYSVGELARTAGVSVRMLHHYDAIGLLKPAHVASNGYRIYGYTEALKLQEILFYRAAGMPLREIAEVLNEEQPLQRLLTHRQTLAKDLANQAAMLATLDRTIAHLRGDAPMSIEDLYKPFSAQQQADYEDWLVETYGPEMAEAIEKAHKHAEESPERFSKNRIKRLREIETALVESYEAGAAPESVDLTAHQNWVSDMWGQPCDAQAYRKLSELYLAHPDFIARFETLSQGFSRWLSTAMTAWSERN